MAISRAAWPWSAPQDYRVGRELPCISVITANYNGSKFLEATLRSVLCQGYPNLQYIVVDGDSTDESPAIIDRYRSHIAIVIREPDRGHAEALNKGFALVDGEILCWIIFDDMHLPWALSTVAEIFSASPEVDWIEGSPAHWDEDGRLYIFTDVCPNSQFNQFDYLIGNYTWI